MKLRRASASLWSVAGLALALVLGGCFDLAMQQEAPQRATVQLTSSDVRASRRAYHGAPPVIPHTPQGVACDVCHTNQGKEIPGMGHAPANPHSQSLRAGSLHNCRQCHVFSLAKDLFADSDFHGLTHAGFAGEKAHPHAPPVVPHSLLMRENCLACHSGPAARPEIRCSHAERTNCRQCHLVPASKEFASLHFENEAAASNR
jgi:cytochrome c-type protein NapB